MAKKTKLEARALAACAVRGIDPAQVQAVRITEVDIFLTVTGLGEVRVEISALPAAVKPVSTAARRGRGGRRGR